MIYQLHFIIILIYLNFYGKRTNLSRRKPRSLFGDKESYCSLRAWSVTKSLYRIQLQSYPV